ncbi:MAG: methyltransferase domain-containing protein [Nocardioides sp.]
METEALVEHVFSALLGTVETLAIHLGDQLGTYGYLHEHGPATEAELAVGCGVNARYAREWLEQQTAARMLTVDDAGLPAAERRYTLPAEHAPVLVDRDSVAFLAPFARMAGAAAAQLPALLSAYRDGGGVAWSTYGATMRTGQADANRPLFLGPLGTELLPSVPDLDARLRAGASVADIGCGDGWSSIGIARAYPQVRVDGFDIDAASVEQARRNAAAYDVADRVSFTLVDGSAAEGSGYDVVTFFECVHDMPDPVSVLAGARRLVADDGTVVVMDEKVAETFAGPGDEVERMMYGFSLLVCLPDGLSTPGSVGTGTVMRPSTLESYAVSAGFSALEVLPVEHDFFRFYRLLP